MVQLLVKLWQYEEKRIGAHRGEAGSNVRAKIYCLMFRIGFNDQVPGVTTGNYVTLALIEKYYDFKVSEGGMN